MPPELESREQELEALLRRCVECGLCLPHCATWAATGNEVQSPRGRLTLLSHLHSEGSTEAPTAFLEAFDLCIGCRACEAVCPSGVPFELLERGQKMAAASLPGRLGSAAGLPGFGILLRRLDSVPILQFLARSGDLTRRLLRAILGPAWRRKMDSGPGHQLARMLNSLPSVPNTDLGLRKFLDGKCGQESFSAPARVPASQGNLTKVAFFTGCANAGLLPAASRRLISLLEASGCQVSTVTGQDCCGALANHSGRPGRAASLRRTNQTAFAPYLSEDHVILVEAAGCGLELREKYGEEFAARVTDAVVLLAGLDLPPLGEVPLQVTYHDPCHARHGQGIIAEPRQLLGKVPGLKLVEPLEPEVCCGSGGAWGLTHLELSQRLGRRKAADLAATGANLVLTSNPGCQGQIADGLAFEAPGIAILPLTDLIWYAWQKA